MRTGKTTYLRRRCLYRNQNQNDSTIIGATKVRASSAVESVTPQAAAPNETAKAEMMAKSTACHLLSVNRPNRSSAESRKGTVKAAKRIFIDNTCEPVQGCI